MRIALTPFVAAVVVASYAHVAHADPVRVAVVGFTGDLSAQELTDLAASIRGSLSRQADPKAIVVVTREEMALVYSQRGAPCRPDDVACIVDASDAWQARLFVRGVVRKASDGVVVGATLESVRGVLVATSQTPPSSKYDMGVAVPFLVRELLDGEKSYRTHNFTAPAAATTATTPSASTSAPAPITPAGPVRCKCKGTAKGANAIAGELVADDTGVSFESSGANKVQWRYHWDKIAGVTTSASNDVKLESTTTDALTLSCSSTKDRDACFAGLQRNRRH